MAAHLELTPAQVNQARLAGIPADREGLLGEYPRMLYRRGNGDHSHLGKPLPVQGLGDFETKTVENEEAELEALEAGWARSPTDAAAPAPKSAKSGV